MSERAERRHEHLPASAVEPGEEAPVPPTSTLPFDLPAELRGLEGFVFEKTARVADPHDAERFERAARLVVSELEHRVSDYRALGRFATNKDSLPARLVRASEG